MTKNLINLENSIEKNSKNEKVKITWNPPIIKEISFDEIIIPDKMKNCEMNKIAFLENLKKIMNEYNFDKNDLKKFLEKNEI